MILFTYSECFRAVWSGPLLSAYDEGTFSLGDEWRAKSRMILCACLERSKSAHFTPSEARFCSTCMFNDTQLFWVIFVAFFYSGSFFFQEKGTRERWDEREGQEKKRKMNESEVIEEMKTFPLYLYLLWEQALPNCKAISVVPPVT